MSVFVSELRRYRLLYFVIAAYVAACWLLSIMLGASEKFMPLMYTGRWFVLLELLTLICAIAIMLRSLRAPRPLSRMRALLADLLRHLRIVPEGPIQEWIGSGSDITRRREAASRNPRAVWIRSRQDGRATIRPRGRRDRHPCRWRRGVRRSRVRDDSIQ